ncbi:MAG: hypothetical protein JXR66_01970 [Bacteroidales bacterium]|nr:hypothetical protein [Bacteroidales bacterium]
MDSPVITRKDIPEAKFINTRHFTGESLFGYMNGGAELYREYGIIDAVISEFEIEGRYFKCEVFRMKDREAAFGIFSVSRFRCREIPTLPGISCQTPYHLQLCKGCYYVSIINRSGIAADSVLSLKIGGLIAARIEEPPADISGFMPGTDKDYLHNNAVLFKGKLGMANGAGEWEDYLCNLSDYVAVILPYEEKTVISVKFNSENGPGSFLELKGWKPDDSDTVVIQKNETVRIINKNQIIITIGNH